MLFQTTEFPSDNVLIEKSTTDPLWLSFNRAHILSQENTSYLWATGYKIILNCNQVINNAVVDGSTSDESRQYIGETYMYREWSFLTWPVFSFPPSHGLDNDGVILRTTLGGEDAKARATVGETYRQIINDLWTGANLMTSRASDGIRYGNRAAALGYLSRAYLFTEQFDSVVAVASMVLDGNSAFELDSRGSYIDALHNTATSSEAMFILLPRRYREPRFRCHWIHVQR